MPMPWNFDPTLLVPLTATTLAYGWGAGRLWQRAGTNRGVTIWQAARFLSAILALLIALVSPLDALSGDLFSAHMVQHLILILVAAPLLVTSDLPLALLWALPRGWARALAPRLYHSRALTRAWQGLSSPVSAWLLFTITLWIWHASALFEWALRDETVHAVEHLLFLTTAMLFWHALFKRSTPDHYHYGMAVPYLFATCLQSTVLGALMTFTGEPWYAYYAELGGRWGLGPLQDQQLAGLLMWMPGSFVFTVLTIGYFAAWFHALEQRSAIIVMKQDEMSHGGQGSGNIRAG